MAIRIEPGANLDFGIMADGSVTATHGRFRKAAANEVVAPLAAAVATATWRPCCAPGGPARTCRWT